MPFFERLRPIFRSDRAIAILLVALVSYYGLEIARSGVGPGIAVHSWRAAVRSLVGLKTLSVAEMEPVDQARYWLARVESVGSKEAELMCGAAILLDQPLPGYFNRKLRRRREVFGGEFAALIPPVELDEEAIRRSKDEFETLCGDSVLKLISQATALQPENRELWRARALLTFRTTPFSADWRPRTDTWPAVLSEGARHDPENGLYDLIAAVQCFRGSARLDLQQPEIELQVRDEAAFREGVEHLDAALARPHLQLGDGRRRWVWQFVSRAGDARVDAVASLGLAGSNVREMYLFREFVRWQQARARRAAEQGTLPEAARILADTRRLIDRYAVRDGNNLAMATTHPILLQVVLATQEWFADQYPDTLSKEQLDAVREERRTTIAAQEKLVKGPPLEEPPFNLDSGVMTTLGVLAWFAPRALLPSLVLAGGLFLLRSLRVREGTSGRVPPFAWRRMAGCWFAGLILSLAAAFAVAWFPAGESPPTGPHVVWQLVENRYGRSASALLTWVNWPLEWILPLLMLASLGFWIVVRRNLVREEAAHGVVRNGTPWFLRDSVRCLWPVCALLLLLHLLFLPTLVQKSEARSRDWSAWQEPAVRWEAWDRAIGNR